jgi:hypothetical protein
LLFEVVPVREPPLSRHLLVPRLDRASFEAAAELERALGAVLIVIVT